MTPDKPDEHRQLFRHSLETMLNDKHLLCQLANTIDGQRIEQALFPCYSPDMGRPGNATRLMVGLHYLKGAYNESDESIIQRWVENPYGQYLCGNSSLYFCMCCGNGPAFTKQAAEDKLATTGILPGIDNLIPKSNFFRDDYIRFLFAGNFLC